MEAYGEAKPRKPGEAQHRSLLDNEARIPNGKPPARGSGSIGGVELLIEAARSLAWL